MYGPRYFGSCRVHHERELRLARSRGDRAIARLSLSEGGASSRRLEDHDGVFLLVRLGCGDRFLAHTCVLGELCGHGCVGLEALRCGGPV
jgi:hypothetical protein